MYSTPAYSFLIIFENSLHPDQDDRTSVLIWIQTVDTLIEFLKDLFRNFDFEKSQQTTIKACKITQHANEYSRE